jgi:DNA-binding response OmpR family regulator
VLPVTIPHKRVLVVEDDFVLTELLSQILGAGGYRVCTASDGLEAVTRGHAKEPPNLILLDLRLPRADGFDFLRRRQADSALAAIPVVIVTGAGDVDREVAALGAADCLHKPLDPVTLLQTVRRLCG